MSALSLKIRTLVRTIACLGVLAFVVPILFNLPQSAADIYRWQDEQGHWHYSDSPPSDIDTEQLSSSGGRHAASNNATWLPAPSPEHARSQAINNASGLFWRISQPGQKPSYLLGTIHSSDPRVTRLRPQVQSALDGADRFVMEMIMDSSALLAFGTSIRLADGNDLEHLLGENLFKKVVAAMTDYGMPEMVVRQLKPWVVMAMLSMPKPSGETILDLVLYQRAQSLGIPASGLESAREQLAVFEGMPLADQIELLKLTIDQQPSIPSMFKQLLEAYLADNLDRIETLAHQYKTQQNRPSLKRFMLKLNEERNRRMLARVIPYLKQGNAFIAIGALHLAGPEGVVNLLRDQGYRLECVRN